MRQRTTAAALSRRHPLLALRLRRDWRRAVQEHHRSTLHLLRVGSPHLRRVAVPADICGVAALEFADGRVVCLRGVQRAAAAALDAAVRREGVELVEGAHPGPVWALYFREGGSLGRRLALLAQAVHVVSGGGGVRPNGWTGPPPALIGV